MRSFDELNRTYKIRRRVINETRRRRSKEPYDSEFDVVVEPVQIKVFNAEYRVVKNAPGLSNAELATICAQGESILGWRAEGNIISIPISIELRSRCLCSR